MSDWMIFAERLSEQMKKQNLSIRQLAESMDMAPTTIFRYAKGQRVPRASEILKASSALGVTCDYLLGLSDDPKKTSRTTVEPLTDDERCIGEKKAGRMSDIKFYIPKFETIPTNLRLYVEGVYVTYHRIDNGFRFEILLDDETEAMKVAEKIVERMKFEHDEAQHGISWRTKSLVVIRQEERYKIGTIIDWEYYVRDSY